LKEPNIFDFVESLEIQCADCKGTGILGKRAKCEGCNGRGRVLTDTGERVATVVILILDRLAKR
jgi:RecJ-like exonuclease